MVSGCWLFRKVGSFLVAMVKEESNEKKLDSENDFIPLSPLIIFLFYLVLVSETGEIKGEPKK